jgi:tetratricopeptide (TPR) repeat protein
MTAATEHIPAQALNRAVSAYKAGHLVEVERLCLEIIATNHDLFDALFLLAIVQTRLGKVDAALATYDRVVNVRPGFAEAHFNRGNVLQTLKRYDEALASYDRALALRRDYPRALARRGKVLHRLRRHDEALASYDRAIHLRSDFASAHFNRGNVLQDVNRYDEALGSYERALALRPDYAAAHSNRGNVLQKLKQNNEALASYNRAIELRPDFAVAHYNRGNVLQYLNRYDEALASYERALAVLPDFAEALSNRGNVLQRLKRFEEAVASYDRALISRPHFSEALSNRGAALQELKRYDEALASFQGAVKVTPDYGDAHFNEALCRLLIGDFERGWEMLEWRWQSGQLRNDKRIFKQPLWLGKSEIAGKTILLHSEQGFGDTIQFSRYVPLVAERGARVILDVQEPLKDLMTGLVGTTQVVARGSALPDFDVHCPLLSLPLAFGTRLETIPPAVPGLRASPQVVMDWDSRLGPKRRPMIGVAWSGLPSHTNDHNRSMRLSALLPLLEVDATFVSLQKDVHPEDATTLKKRNDILHFGNEIRNFSDTAALISNLDLVISVDTSVAHLAGTMAKPAWVLLPFTSDWRWLIDRDDSPWYPTARLFRQDDTRAWDSVIARVHAALRDFI